MEETIKIREKGQYETNTEYLNWINQQIEKQNAILIQKNSEIAELKSTVASLQAEKAKMEKEKVDTVMTKTEEDLKVIVNDLNKVLIDNKNNQKDERIDVLISKVDEALIKYASIEQEYRIINEELSKPVNFGGIQDYIKRQDEIEAIIREVYDTVKTNKDEIIAAINSNNNSQVINNVPQIDSMEQAVNMTSNQEIQPNSEVPYAKPMLDQISNYENQMNEELQQEQNLSQSQVEPNVFEQTLNPDVNANTLEQPGTPTIEPITPTNTESQTIVPDASILESIQPNEETNTVENNKDNVIQENVQVQDNIEQNQMQEQTIPEGAEKVQNVEEVTEEYTKNAIQSMNLNPSSIKARRGFVNKVKESERIEDILNIKSWFVDNAKLNDATVEYFNGALNQNVEQQAAGRTR